MLRYIEYYAIPKFKLTRWNQPFCGYTLSEQGMPVVLNLIPLSLQLPKVRELSLRKTVSSQR